MRRGESMLVAAYAETIPAGVAFGRRQTAAGATDLWINWGDYQELVEAKSLPDHDHVRQALARCSNIAAPLVAKVPSGSSSGVRWASVRKVLAAPDKRGSGGVSIS